MSHLRLEEHQVKELLNEKGINTPEGFVVDVKSLDTSVPASWKDGFVMKAQVPTSSRYKKGLITIESDPEELKEQGVQLLQTMKQYGDYPRILVEQKVLHDTAYYMAIISDPISRGPLFIFSQHGGSDVENILEASGDGVFTQKINVLDGLNKSDIRQIAEGAGITLESKLKSFVEIASKLYEIYRDWQCRLVELNPLVEVEEGFCVLDAKLEIDEDARGLIEEKVQRFNLNQEKEVLNDLEAQAHRIDENDYRGSAHFVQSNVYSTLKRHGDKIKAFVGFNGVGTGVSLAAMDELVRCGFFPRNFCDTSGNPPASKLYRVTKIILSQDNIQGYVFVSCMSSQQLDNTARGMIKAFTEVYAETGGIPTLPALLLFRGAWDKEAITLFKEHGIQDSKKLVVLGRESTERDAAMRFSKLFEESKNEKVNDLRV